LKETRLQLFEKKSNYRKMQIRSRRSKYEKINDVSQREDCSISKEKLVYDGKTY
jgi:hypothetical protein